MCVCFNLRSFDHYIDRCNEKGVENLSKSELKKVLKITRRLFKDTPQNETALFLIAQLRAPNETIIQKCNGIFSRTILNENEKCLAIQGIETYQKLSLYKKLLPIFSFMESDDGFKISIRDFVLNNPIQSVERTVELCHPIIDGINTMGFTESFANYNKKRLILALHSFSDEKRVIVARLINHLCECIKTYEMVLDILETVENLSDDELEFLAAHGPEFCENLTEITCICTFIESVAQIPKEHHSMFLSQVLPICKSFSLAKDRSELLSIFVKRSVEVSNLEGFIELVNQHTKQFRDPSRRLEAIRTLNKLEERCWKYFANESVIGNEIKRYKGESISLVLLKKLCLATEYPLFFSTYDHMTSEKGRYIVHRLLPSIFASIWMTQAGHNPASCADFQSIRMFIGIKRGEFRDAHNPLMSSFLMTCQAIDETSAQAIDKLKLLDKVCSAGLGITQKEVVNLLNKVMFICKVGHEELFKTPSEDFLKDVSEVHEKLFSTLVLREHQNIEDSFTKYEQTFLSSRYPFCLEVYLSVIRSLEDVELNNSVSRFVACVLEGTLDKERFNTEVNPHLSFIEQAVSDVYEKWKALPSEKPFIFNKGNVGKIGLYSNWEDLFLCGTEVEGSCLRIDGSVEYNKALLAYSLDGKNTIVAIKEPSGKLLCRAVFRILWSEANQAPVFLMEPVYSYNIAKELKIALLRYGLEKAFECGVDLLVGAAIKEELKKDVSFLSYNDCVISRSGPCPYEYSDSS